MEESFKEASLKNARNSVQEEGISRFDLVQVCSWHFEPHVPSFPL
jgi:quinol monooxygenase YgiN